MKTFSSVINENRGSETLQADITRYIKATSGKLPRKVQAALYIIEKYPIIKSKEDILNIRDGHFKIYNQLDILPDDLKDLQRILKTLGNDIKLLPQFLNDYQRQALEQNKLGLQDLSLDLKTKQGREHVAKTYSPLVFKIAGQFVGKSSLSKEELVSAGLEGLVLAMNDYKTSEEMEVDGKSSTQTFAQYASYRIRFSILDEINKHSRTVSQSDYMRNKDGESSYSVSIDGKYGKDEDGDDIKIDRIMQLSEEPDYDLTRKEERQWEKVFKKLEKKFSFRDCNIFYRAFGINGYDKEDGKAIAKSINVSAPFISQTIKKIVNFLRSNDDLLEVLRTIMNLYECNMLSELIDKDKQEVFESIINNDVYMIIETINKWSDPTIYKQIVEQATDGLNTEDTLYIYDCLQSKDYLREGFDKHKQPVIKFLENIYPTESFRRKQDPEIINLMEEIIIYNEKHKLKW